MSGSVCRVPDSLSNGGAAIDTGNSYATVAEKNAEFIEEMLWRKIEANRQALA